MSSKNILTRVSGYSSEKREAPRFHNITSNIFEQALMTKYQSSDFGDLLFEITDSHLNLKHIVKTDVLKQKLSLLVEEKKNFLAIKMHNLPLSNKILLYGQPGCGKTLTAYCLAGELNKPLFIVNLGNIISSRLGETAQNLEKIFQKAKQEKAILFLDEFDALSRDRNSPNEHGEMKRIVNVILQILDLLDEETIFIAATNQFQSLDKAMVRRFNYIIEYSIPNKVKIKEYINFLSDSYHFKFKPKSLKDNFSTALKGCSYSDIKNFIVIFLKEKIFQKKNKLEGKIEIIKSDLARFKEIVTHN